MFVVYIIYVAGILCNSAIISIIISFCSNRYLLSYVGKVILQTTSLSSPDLTDADAWFEFIVLNFERHYTGNRSPFGFYVHEWYLSAYPAVKIALMRFMDMINQLNDVFMVSFLTIHPGNEDYCIFLVRP